MSWKVDSLECTESRPEREPCQHWPSSYFSGVLGALKVSQRCKTAQLSSSAHSDRFQMPTPGLPEGLTKMQNCTAVVICTQNRIQRDADTTFSRELSCAKLCCWVLFSYISGLLEDRAIIQSSLMRWSHSFRLGTITTDVLKLDDNCPPFLSQHGLWRNSGAATRTWHVNKLTWRSLQSRYVYYLCYDVSLNQPNLFLGNKMW